MAPEKMPEWAKNPITLVIVGCMLGGTGATGTYAGVDMLGLSDIKADVAAVRAALEAHEKLQAHPLGEAHQAATDARVAALEANLTEVADTLERLDRNVLLLCSQSGARCVGD
jgi:hypothetical protein